jgi:hypothetical protein
MPPLLPTSQNDPSGLGRAEAFWNSFSCDPSIAVLQSVPAFLLNQASVGPRSSGEVVRQHASARSNQRFVNSFLCLNLSFAERQSYVHICGFNVRVQRLPKAVRWNAGLGRAPLPRRTVRRFFGIAEDSYRSASITPSRSSTCLISSNLAEMLPLGKRIWPRP